MDLGQIQAAYYMVAATGVLVAALYYIVNLRETTKNRRITFTNSVMQQLQTEEGVRREYDCYVMQWTDFEDFKRKYDSRVDPVSYSKRTSLWSTYNSLGYLYKSGLVDLDTIANVGGELVVWDWLKFKPVIEGYRKGDLGPNAYNSFEYLAEAVIRVKERSEPDARARMDMVDKTHRVAQ